MSAAAAPVEEWSSRRPRPARTPVAVLMSRFPSVTETFILREMIEMESQGQPVRLVPMLRESPPVLHDAARPWIERALYTPYFSRHLAASVLRMLLRRPIRMAWLFARLVAGTVRKPDTFVKTLTIFPKSVFIAEQLEREGVRHVHAHYATHPATMALIVASLTDITFSFTVHAHDIQLDHSLLRWKIRKARFIRSISHFNRRYLEDLYPREARGKIEVIHVGIEPERYDRATPASRADAGATPRILCVAAHKPYKGLPFLIEACGLLRDEGVRFHCDLVGHGPMHDELAQMISERGLGGLVTLVGPRSQEEVAEMMNEAAMFVLPSIIAPDGQMEGIPVALMEAMASGRPVVSTMTAGIPELIEHNVSGLLVPPQDAAALASAMKQILEDPARARAFGPAAREKVRREFTLRDCVARLLLRLDLENASGTQ